MHDMQKRAETYRWMHYHAALHYHAWVNRIALPAYVLHLLTTGGSLTVLQQYGTSWGPWLAGGVALLSLAGFILKGVEDRKKFAKHERDHKQVADDFSALAREIARELAKPDGARADAGAFAAAVDDKYSGFKAAVDAIPPSVIAHFDAMTAGERAPSPTADALEARMLHLQRAHVALPYPPPLPLPRPPPPRHGDAAVVVAVHDASPLQHRRVPFAAPRFRFRGSPLPTPPSAMPLSATPPNAHATPPSATPPNAHATPPSATPPSAAMPPEPDTTTFAAFNASPLNCTRVFRTPSNLRAPTAAVPPPLALRAPSALLSAPLSAPLSVPLSAAPPPPSARVSSDVTVARLARDMAASRSTRGGTSAGAATQHSTGTQHSSGGSSVAGGSMAAGDSAGDSVGGRDEAH